MAKTKAEYEKLGQTETGDKHYPTIAAICEVFPQVKNVVAPHLWWLGISDPSWSLLENINAYRSYLAGEVNLPLTKSELLEALKDFPDDAIVYADGCSQCMNEVTGVYQYENRICLSINDKD